MSILMEDKYTEQESLLALIIDCAKKQSFTQLCYLLNVHYPDPSNEEKEVAMICVARYSPNDSVAHSLDGWHHKVRPVVTVLFNEEASACADSNVEGWLKDQLPTSDPIQFSTMAQYSYLRHAHMMGLISIKHIQVHGTPYKVKSDGSFSNMANPGRYLCVGVDQVKKLMSGPDSAPDYTDKPKPTICYSTDDTFAVSDYRVDKWFDSVIASQENPILVTTHAQFSRVKIAVLFGEIQPTTVEYNNQTLSLGDKGNLSEYPRGFLDELGYFVRANLKINSMINSASKSNQS